MAALPAAPWLCAGLSRVAMQGAVDALCELPLDSDGADGPARRLGEALHAMWDIMRSVPCDSSRALPLAMLDRLAARLEDSSPGSFLRLAVLYVVGALSASSDVGLSRLVAHPRLSRRARPRRPAFPARPRTALGKPCRRSRRWKAGR